MIHTLSAYTAKVLNGTINAILGVVPSSLDRVSPSLVTAPVQLSEIGVLVGMMGQVPGRLIVDGSINTFINLGQLMFDMALEGEMLESFVGEFGNMVAGNTATNLSKASISVDISPPTVIIGQSRLSGFHLGFDIPIRIDDAGDLRIMLLLENLK